LSRKIYNGLDLQDQRITNLGDPVTDKDAVNRKFVVDSIQDAPGSSKMALNLGDGAASTFVVTHNFNTHDVVVSVYDLATNEVVLPDIVHTSENVVTIIFGDPPDADAYRVVVVG
jgi:hypothetical protein